VQARATISSFPFLGRLFVQQRVEKIHLHVTDLSVDRLVFATVDVRLDGVHVDRSRLIQDQDVRLRSIDRGTVVAEVTSEELSAALGNPVRIAAGGVDVEVLGKRVHADVQVRDNRLSLQVAGLSVPAFAIPRTSLLPCLDHLQALDGRLHFSCTLDGVPAPLLNLINGAAARAGA
jgi:hypothetical protein